MVMLSFAAAASAPLRTMSQKVSPGAAWVIMATVIFGVLTVPEELCLPPEDEQAARESAATTATPAVATRFEEIKDLPFEHRTASSRRRPIDRGRVLLFPGYRESTESTVCPVTLERST